MNDAILLTAREAALRLGVKLETLYAYVSRGRLRSVAVPGSRERHYRLDDIDAFRAARGAAKAGGEAAAEPLLPVIDSSICLIEAGRLYYRGQDALRLSDSATLEEIAALLWREPGLWREPESSEFGSAPDPSAPRVRPSAPSRGTGRHQAPQPTVIERCQMRLAEIAAADHAAADHAAADLARTGVARTGRNILSQLTTLIGGAAGSVEEPVHHRLARSWGLDEAGADIVRRCLVLLADHELNASTRWPRPACTRTARGTSGAAATRICGSRTWTVTASTPR
jgi:citrate synthase